ncbi:hypothetical protein BN439_1551 [Erwinia amylovora Ea644]|nr:hypothetical protein BN439_1551 [Erwinia amylovora Ea644]CCP06636.1 hypothetical protein BN440_1604 [Erwinia amylovora MR1]
MLVSSQSNQWLFCLSSGLRLAQLLLLLTVGPAKNDSVT